MQMAMPMRASLFDLDDALVVLGAARRLLLLDQHLLDDRFDHLDDLVAHVHRPVEMLVDGLLVGDVGRTMEVDGLRLVHDRRVIDADQSGCAVEEQRRRLVDEDLGTRLVDGLLNAIGWLGWNMGPTAWATDRQMAWPTDLDVVVVVVNDQVVAVNMMVAHHFHIDLATNVFDAFDAIDTIAIASTAALGQLVGVDGLREGREFAIICILLKHI